MEDLSALRLSLGVRSVRTREGQAPPPFEPLAAPTLAQEIYKKFAGKTQPESRQLVAILGAVQEVIKAQGLEVTPTAMFAALMASLEKPETLANGEVLSAMCRMLSMVLNRVPNTILRAKFAAGSTVLCNIVEAKLGDAAVVKNAMPCLAQLLAAFNHADWPSAVRPFNLLLSLCLGERAKVRRAAQAAVGDVLAGLQLSQAPLAQASEGVQKLCQRVLPGPEAAAHAAAAAPGKKRQQAEEAIAAAVADALHLLGALKQWIPLLSGPAAAAVCDLLLKLYPLHQPLLSRHATEVLTALCAAPGGHLSGQGLAELLGAALGSQQLWERRDPDTTVAAIRLMEDGFCRLAAADASLCAPRLPRAVHALVPQLAAEQERVRYGAGACLKNIINECVGHEMVAAALAGGGGSKQPPPLLSVLAALEGSLGAQYQDAWESCLPVCTEMIEKLGSGGAPLAAGLLERIGELCAGGDDAAAAAKQHVVDDQLLTAAQNALGAAMLALGAEAVLAALPLNLSEGLAGSGEARTWLLPLLRIHVRGGRLGYWGKVLLPQARDLGSRAAAAASDPARAREAQVCSALEMQLWATLPSFCSWAQDTADAFKAYAKLLAAAFEKREDLRVLICQAIRRVCNQTRAVLAEAGEPVGYADPCASSGGEEEAAAASPEEQVHLDIPEGYTPDMARRNLAVLRSMAKNWMPLLLTTFVATPAVQRTQLEEAISAYAACCDPPTLAQFFRSAITKLIKVTQQAQTGELGPGAVLEGGDTDSERRGTFLELSLALAAGLDASGLETLYKAAKPGIQEKEASVQKKCYKVLAYVCEQRPDFLESHFQDMLDTLLAGMASSHSAAKRNRLRCLKAAVLAAARPDGPAVQAGDDAAGASSRDDATKQIVASMVSEIILSVKERNKQTRATAFDLLVQIAHAMHEAEPPPAELSLDADMGGTDEEGAPRSRGGLHTLFTMVLGGLVGATPHMMSATVMALARLLYEFAPVLAGLVPDLLPAVLMLLRSKAREVIKSVLGFIKVVSLRLPVDDLTGFLPQILEGILLWAEDSKNKFRAKVRWIVEKLAKRCGFEAVAQYMPEAHAKLLSHIRKENNRRDRRQSEAGSQMEVDEAEEIRSRKSHAKTVARTTRGSEWNEDVFSDSDASGEQAARTIRTRMTEGGHGKVQRRAAQGGMLPGSKAGTDPVDLLDQHASRQLVQALTGKGRRQQGADDGINFETNAGGKMIIKDDQAKKRKRDDGWDSDDSDFEDLKGFERSGLSLALKGAKSVALAPSIAASLGGKTLGAKSLGTASRGGRSAGGRSQQSHGERSQKHQKGSQHSGDRFKAKKKGTGGDVKGGAKVEPYAYWPLDRRLMNRRQQKSKGAKEGLDKIVVAAKAGAAKGNKAKRLRQK